MRLECSRGPAYLRRVMPVRRQESRLSIYQSGEVYLQEAAPHVRAFFLHQARFPLSLWARFLYTVFRRHILTRTEILSDPRLLLAALSVYRQYVLPFSHPDAYPIVRGQTLATWLQTFPLDPEVGLTEEVKQALESRAARTYMEEIGGSGSPTLQRVRSTGLCLLESALDDILKRSETYAEGLWPEESLLVEAVLGLSGRDERWIWVVETVGSQEAKRWIARRLCAPVPGYVFLSGCVRVEGRGMYGRDGAERVYAHLAGHLGIGPEEKRGPDAWVQALTEVLSPERPLLLIVVDPVDIASFEWLQEVPATHVRTVVIASYEWVGAPERVWMLRIGPPSEGTIGRYWEVQWRERGVRRRLTAAEEEQVKEMAEHVGYNLDEVNRLVRVVNNRYQMAMATKALQDKEARAMLLGYQDGAGYWERLVRGAALGWGAPYYDLRDACVLLGTKNQAVAFSVLEWGVKAGEAYELGEGRYVIKERVLNAYRAGAALRWGALVGILKWGIRLRLMNSVRPFAKEAFAPVSLIEKIIAYLAPFVVWGGEWERLRRGVLEYVVMTKDRTFETAFVMYRGENASFSERVVFYRYKFLTYTGILISLILTLMKLSSVPLMEGRVGMLLHLSLLVGMLRWFALWQLATWPRERVAPQVLGENAVPAE